MCQRIYLGSRNTLPLLTRSGSAPHLAILSLSSDAAGIRRWFSPDATHFAEAHGSLPCGCGFPEVSDDGPQRPVSHHDRAAVEALASYLEQRPGKRYVAELLLCWTGDEAERPRHSREIRLTTVRESGFRFRRGELLRIRSDET
jgi:hypothetical protein